MVGHDDVRDELVKRADHAIPRVDSPERAEDVGAAELALRERGVLRVVLDEEDANCRRRRVLSLRHRLAPAPPSAAAGSPGSRRIASTCRERNRHPRSRRARACPETLPAGGATASRRPRYILAPA